MSLLPWDDIFADQLATDIIVEQQQHDLPAEPHSGQACWWSNRGDSIDSTLTRVVDLTGVASATLRFRMWLRTEEFWDYAYVAVSTDGGLRWEALEGERTSVEDTLGNALGPGYTGATDGWVEECIDLAPFAGQHVQLRFEYLTDDSVNGDGWCVDDVSIPELGYSDDAESDGRWTIGNRVAQTYLVSLVTGRGDSAQVQRVALDSSNHGVAVVEEPAVLVVSATALNTGQSAPFVLRAVEAP